MRLADRLFNIPLLLRLYRAGVLVVLVVLVHRQATWFEAQRSTTISIRQARSFFPTANRVQLRDPERGLHIVTDARGETIGCLLTTSPHTDHIVGYSGPNNLLIALDRTGAVAGIELLRSGDTREHVNRVVRHRGFLARFTGWKSNETPPPKIEAVSGATLTSFAIAEAVQQRLAGAAPSLRFPEAVTLAEVQLLFTNATRVASDQQRLSVFDSAGGLLGFAVRTSPQSDNVSGYRGPSDCLVALATDGRTITGLRVRASYDTDSYVEQIRKAEAFTKLFVGRTIEELAAFEYPKERIEGVTGATQTGRAVAEGMKRRFGAAASKPPPARFEIHTRDFALAAVIAGALVISFSSLRGHRWARVTWQLLLVGYVGLVNHDLLSLALFGGWAANGVPLKAAQGLVLMGAAALFVPWTTRRQLYCHHLCAHGAAQHLLGSIFRRRWTLPAKLTHALEFIPGILLAVALLALLTGWTLNLANIEPFDAWAWRTAATVSVVIAAAGLIASIFVPRAYCRFGCPTGALLNFVRATGSGEHWGKRDWTALGLVVISLAAFGSVRAWPRSEPVPEPAMFTGRTMGTTWSVKIRDEVADHAIIDKAIAREFESAESLTSHWRTNTDLSIFNRTATTNAMPVPWPVLTLARKAGEISRATGGAFDITVGPLVRLWGFGPAPRRTNAPSDAEIDAVRAAVGWEKIELLDGMMRKRHPQLELDLSSIAKGWAIDQAAQMLELRGYTNFLVEAGGELRARGHWTVAIEHPARTCTLTNETIATSGTYRQNFRSATNQFSHLIDPRTGRPAAHRTVSVSVRHAECALADAWATALNVLGSDDGLPLAERLKVAAQFVVERPNGKLEVLQSSAWSHKR